MEKIEYLKRKITSLSNFTLQGLIQIVYLKMSKKDLVVRGECRLCGNCCRAINLEGPEGWIKSEKYFNKLLEKNSEFGRFSVLKRDSSGYLVFYCNKLGKDNLCTDYENRPSVCRDFPKKELSFCGGGLPTGCGYRFEEIKSFKKVLHKEMERNS